MSDPLSVTISIVSPWLAFAPKYFFDLDLLFVKGRAFRKYFFRLRSYMTI